MSEAALLLTCRGCCCGHPESGGPKTAPRALRADLRRAHREGGLEGTVRLAFSDCLGPCGEANVLYLTLGGRNLWFRRMNDRSLCESLLGWIRQALATPATPLPPALQARTFRWAGGGEGPEPPVDTPVPASAGAGTSS